MNMSKVGQSVTSRSTKNVFGFVPIPMDKLERSCEHAKRWLNEYLTTPEIVQFPGDIINDDGRQIYELIEFLTKKSPAWVRFDHNMKKNEKVQKLYESYLTLIHFLKENGAMLNTIRPEYLLNHSDQVLWYRLNPNPNVININKVPESRWRYLSMDAWLVVFHQILKIYYLCRINLKSLKALPSFPSDKASLGEGYNEANNIYSQPEIIL